MKYKSTSIKSKWTKTKWLLKGANIRKYVPQTLLFSRSSLTEMVNKYATVYFKPTGGSGGFNIIRVTKQDNGYQTQHNAVKTHYASLNRLYKGLKKRAKGTSYLLQKGIKLAKTKGKPFDIRVMVQKTDKEGWKSTALFTKVGKPGKVATNYNQGGSLEYFQKTLAGAGLSKAKIKRKEKELKKLGVSVGKLFDRRAKGFRELGLDVALESGGRAWILEVNTRPQFYPLKDKVDKGLYRRIISYAKQYGRKG